MNQTIIYQNKNKTIYLIHRDNQKLILKQFLKSDSLMMLKNEENILKNIESLNISPKLIEANYQNNYLIMNYINGCELNKYPYSSFNNKIEIFLKVIEAVKKLHSKNIIHCDLKPSNILIDENDEIKIIDYDISKFKLEKNNQYISIHYCSLEQINNQEITELTDIYSLGIIFYVLILGKFPFDGTKKEIINKKRKALFEEPNNVLLKVIFKRFFDYNNPHYFKNLDELIYMVKLFINKNT